MAMILKIIAFFPLMHLGTIVGVLLGMLLSMLVTTAVLRENTFDKNKDLYPHTYIIIYSAAALGAYQGARGALKL